MQIKPKDSETGRYYPWKDEKFVSVTTVIKEGIPKPGLNRWFMKRQAEIAADNRHEIADMTKIEAKDWIMSQNLFGGGEDAAKLGTRVHSLCEKIAEGKEVRPPTETEKPYVEAFNQFLFDHKPLFLETESTVFSRKYGYGGTMDAVVVIDGKTYIVDYKTGKKVWPEAALQLSAYRYANFIGRARGLEDELPDCDGGLIVHIRPEGYTVVPVDTSDAVFDTFLSALDVFRWNRIDGDLAIERAWR